MRQYCKRLQHGDKISELNNYQNKLQKIREWYLQQYEQYQLILKSEMFMKMSSDILGRDDSVILSIDDYTENFGAKLSLYCVADFLSKHMLSCYSYGPERTMGMNFEGHEYSKSWFALHRDTIDIYEILQFVLQSNGEGEHINLSVLLEDRNVRSELTHGGEMAVCMSAIRCYNILRDMLIFMDSECISVLPKFEYPNISDCDMLAFFEHTNNLDFNNGTTILITGSLHDIQKDQKALLANMPWDIVIDFDGISQFGGLRSAVIHEKIRSQLLTPDVTSNLVITKGITTWLTCGEFVSPTHAENSKSISLIPHKRAFYGLPYKGYYTYISGILRDIIRKSSEMLNPVTIVYIYSDDGIAEEFLKICEELLDNTSYSFTGVYYLPDDNVKRIEQSVYRTYRRMGEDYSERFKFFSFDLDSFFSGIMSYQGQFACRNSQKSDTLLPSNEGPKSISVNDASNLNDYFEVLYNDCGNEDPESAQELVVQFYRGGLAPWCAFRNYEVAELVRQVEYERHIRVIRSHLGRIPDANKDKIFYIEHKPGIGGSTLMRQIGWSLHEDYPVMLIKRYEKGTISKLIIKLYDQLHKGIVILADENFEDIDKLEQDIKSLPRACVLIASVRQRMNQHPDAQKIPFPRITDKSEEQLIKLFKKHSPLTKEEQLIKDTGFSTFISQDQASMRCPFMIGLYYMENNFNGVYDYVEQIIHRVSNETELKAMAFICLADFFGQISLPVILINKYLGISPRSNYLDTHPYVSGAIIKTTHKETIVYQSKHYLISQHLLDKCSIKLYHSGYQEHLSELALDFIDFILKACNEKFSETYQIILERVFITSRIGDVSNGQSDFARIVEEIQVPEARKQVLLKLAEGSASLADRSNPLEISSLYMMTAHFYGHLSRLCSKRSAGIENANNAVDFSEKAVIYMEKCKGNDPFIYHMYGDARLNALKRQWDDYRYQTNSLTPADYSNFEDEIELINNIFDDAADAGSPDYALTSKIDMLISYLRFVFQEKKIHNIKDLNKLSEKQASYRMDIEELICQIDEIPLGEITHSIFIRLENEYRSTIMMRNYGKAIEYYQNKLDELQKTPELAIDILIARQGLINARLGKYRSMSSNGQTYYSEISDKDVDEILNLLDATMEQSFDANRYQERQRRISVYNRWFQLSKFSNRPVDQGIQVALKWEYLEKIDRRNDPRPYYYLYVLYYLSVLDGTKSNWSKAIDYQRLSYQKAQAEGYRLDSIRDLIVEGSGMNRLLDMKQITNIAEELNKSNLNLMALSGYFKEIQAKKGLVDIRQPISWINSIAKFNIGDNNSLGTAQVTHKIEFYGGFSYEQIVAVDSSVRDTDSGEILLPNTIISKSSKSKYQTTKIVQTKNNISPDSDIVFPINLFVPDDLLFNPDGLPQYLNGTIADSRASLSYRDLKQYETSELKKLGGVKAIMELLFNRGNAFPVVITGKNELGYLTLSLFSTGYKIDDVLADNVPILDLKNKKICEDTYSKTTTIPINEDIAQTKSKECKALCNNANEVHDNSFLKRLKNTTVQFTSEKETADGLFGTFTAEGRIWNGIIPRLAPKEKKQLVHKTFKAKVVSCKSWDKIVLSLLK